MVHSRVYPLNIQKIEKKRYSRKGVNQAIALCTILVCNHDRLLLEEISQQRLAKHVIGSYRHGTRPHHIRSNRYRKSAVQ